eukprot:RCo005851
MPLVAGQSYSCHKEWLVKHPNGTVDVVEVYRCLVFTGEKASADAPARELGSFLHVEERKTTTAQPGLGRRVPTPEAALRLGGVLVEESEDRPHYSACYVHRQRTRSYHENIERTIRHELTGYYAAEEEEEDSHHETPDPASRHGVVRLVYPAEAGDKGRLGGLLITEWRLRFPGTETSPEAEPPASSLYYEGNEKYVLDRSAGLKPWLYGPPVAEQPNDQEGPRSE